MTDWSKIGVGAWLLQKHCKCEMLKPFCCPDGWQVTLFASKYLSETESRYAPIEGEALALTFGLEKSKYFILGCPDLIVCVDHKPLLGLFSKRDLENIPNARLRNLKEKTLPYRFQIMHISGVKNKVADCLSRHPSEPANHLDLIDDMPIEAAAIEGAQPSAITIDRVANHTALDPTMRTLLRVIEDGFPECPTELPSNIKIYHKFSDHLRTWNDLITYKNRIVIPEALRADALNLLHAAHQGSSSMIARAEQCMFWPGITNDIRSKRDKCMKCHKLSPSQPDAPPQQPSIPNYPFQLLCADYFSYKGVSYLIIVDRYSGWPIVKKVDTNASALINALKEAINTFGVPEELASDGGPPFTSTLVKSALASWGITQRISSVAYPRSNGRAEVAVKTMRRLLMDNTQDNGSLNSDGFLQAILTYRNTPDSATGISPAMYIFHRPIRDFLPDINVPTHLGDTYDIIQTHQEARRNHLVQHQPHLNEHTRKLPPLRVGDKVFVQNQTGPSPTKWDYTGVIIEVKQYDQYVVKMDHSGRPTLRNRKFLRLRKDQRERSHGDNYPVARPVITSPSTKEPLEPVPSEDLTPNLSIPEPSFSSHEDDISDPTPDPPPSIPVDKRSESPVSTMKNTATREPEITEETSTRRSQRITRPPERLNYSSLGNQG